MTRRKILLVLAVAFAVLVLATLPYKTIVEDQLKKYIAAQGIENLTFSVKSLGLSGMVLRDITLTTEHPLTLDSLTLDYSVFELLSGNLRELHIDSLRMRTPAGIVEARDVVLSFSPEEKGGSWRGIWSVANVAFQESPLTLVPIAGAGSFAADRAKATVAGDFKSSDASYKATFALDYLFDKAKPSALRILSAYAPWNGGVLATQNALIPLGTGKPARFTVQMQRVSLDGLLKLLVAGRAAATGTMTGAIPVTIGPDGRIYVETGSLKAETAGTIMLAPDAIPGDNEQVALVREVMQNFHYSVFTLKLQSGGDEKLSILLQLAGNNPDAYNGQEVKLNVQLQGDLLELLQQSILPLADPKQLLKQGNYESK
jgi:hypothetical protein